MEGESIESFTHLQFPNMNQNPTPLSIEFVQVPLHVSVLSSHRLKLACIYIFMCVCMYVCMVHAYIVMFKYDTYI